MKLCSNKKFSMKPLLSWKAHSNVFAVYPAFDFTNERKSPEDKAMDEIGSSSVGPRDTIGVITLSDIDDSISKSELVTITPIQIKKPPYRNTDMINPEVTVQDSPGHPQCMEWLQDDKIALGIGPAVHLYSITGEVVEDYVSKKKFLLGGRKFVPTRLRANADDILHYQEVTRKSSHQDLVQAISYNQGDLLASASKDCVLRIWNLKSSRRMTDNKGHSSQVNAVQWNPSNGNLLLSGSNNEVLLADYAVDQPSSKWVTGSSVTSVVWNPSHEKLFMDGGAYRYDTRVQKRDKVDDTDISVVAYHPIEENVFVTGSTTGSVKIWGTTSASCQLKEIELTISFLSLIFKIAYLDTLYLLVLFYTPMPTHMITKIRLLYYKYAMPC